MDRFINDFKKYYKYAIYSAKSELKAEVASSYLNWIWWVLEPLCFMLIYSFIFGVVFNASEENFTIFVFIGIMAWDFFNGNMKQSVKMIKNNKAIVSKVYIPKFVLIFSKMLVNGFKMMICFGIVILMMIVCRVSVTWNILYIIPIMITLWIVNFGFMTILLHFGVFIEDLSNVVNIVLRAVFYMTGIFYAIENRIPSPYSDILLKGNPIAFSISSFRRCLLYGERPSLKVLLIWIVVGLIISTIGVKTIYKNENSYVKVI
ncbi:ABC transporter permease [Terrisporobacter vanillatitrophus]|uniref:ABC transporter permease n=1 Tax=Terrisporobacter vanillatitrophus TaxID=3058402 RepID=UPI0033682755